MKNYKFPKQLRLLKASEFDRVFSNKSSASDGVIIVYATMANQGAPRLGLVVSKKCGNAVRRNTWKRYLREAFRLSLKDLPSGMDLVILPKPNAAPSVDLLRESLIKLINRLAKKLQQNHVIT